MKKLSLTILVIGVLLRCAYAQNFNNIVNYNSNTTPVNGVKIKTNLPFTMGSQMPTITISGFNYGTNQTIGLQIVYYIYNTGSGYYYPDASITSFGTYAPPVTIANESGKVVIYINDRPYFQRFTVSAFAQGMSADVSASYTGWTVADEALTGTNQILLPYTNNFTGTVTMPGTGIWNSLGNVGIGTTNTQGYKLAVNGSVIATAVTVKLYTNWPDYVFSKNYRLPALSDIKSYIDHNHHLPDMPSEKEVAKDGINLGEMNKLLTKKVEELTLYMIEKDKEMNKQNEELKQLKEQVKELIKAGSKN